MRRLFLSMLFSYLMMFFYYYIVIHFNRNDIYYSKIGSPIAMEIDRDMFMVCYCVFYPIGKPMELLFGLAYEHPRAVLLRPK